MNHIIRNLITLVLTAFLAGCATGKSEVAKESAVKTDVVAKPAVVAKPDVAIVAQTLAKYEVGHIIFSDFKKDAGLMVVERTVTPKAWPKSYIAPQLFPQQTADDLKPRIEQTYETPAGSPWKIYEVGHFTYGTNGVYSKMDKFVVGDINHAISILSFDEWDRLASISPAP